MLPFPVGRGMFIWGEPIWVASDLDTVDLEIKRKELEDALNRITLEADTLCSSP